MIPVRNNPPPLLPPPRCPRCLSVVPLHTCMGGRDWDVNDKSQHLTHASSIQRLLASIAAAAAATVCWGLIIRKVLHPGFISSQVSSCPALGASTPVRMLPLSTWMTLTGRSLIWLVSSRGCVNGGRLSFLENSTKALNSEKQFSRNKLQSKE